MEKKFIFEGIIQERLLALEKITERAPNKTKQKSAMYFRSIQYRNINTTANPILIKLFNFKVKTTTSHIQTEKAKSQGMGKSGWNLQRCSEQRKRGWGPRRRRGTESGPGARPGRQPCPKARSSHRETSDTPGSKWHKELSWRKKKKIIHKYIQLSNKLITVIIIINAREFRHGVKELGKNRGFI